MGKLYAGFGRVNVTPMLGIAITGYFKERYAEGILDDLEINALALQCGDEKAMLMSIDNLHLSRETTTAFRQHISDRTGFPMESIYIHSTHTHTGPMLDKGAEGDLEKDYYKTVYHKMADVAQMAMEDLKPAQMGWGIGQAPNIAFVRRFRMKDGSVKTNPGVNNPDILEPIGDVDERVSVLRFTREGADDIVYVNFGDHPDTVGGNKISADWPGLTRKNVEKVLDGTKCLVFNGAQGDINHVNVHPTGGYLNGMFMDFDDVSRGYAHAEYMSRVVTGGVLQAFDKVKYVDVESIRCKQRTINVPSNMPKPEDMAEAHRINDLHNAGKDAELPYEGMMLTTVVAEAGRMVRLEHGPEAFEMDLSGIAIGDVVLIGIPGEPFLGIGRGLKEAEGWDLILPSCLTNGSHGYFPMKDAYEQGGYEARSSNFKEGVAEFIIEEGRKLLAELR